jgi:hypothetical protein
MIPLQSYIMFEVLQIITINRSVGFQRIFNFRWLRDAFLYRLASGITLQQGVP